MSDHRTDEAIGRAREAAGSLTGDDEMKNKGKADRASSSAKKKAEDAKDRANDAIDSVKEKLTG